MKGNCPIHFLFPSYISIFLVTTRFLALNLFIFTCCSALYEVINRPADGGITALHMATLNGHAETVQLLLDLGASVSEVTVEDGSTIDLIGKANCKMLSRYC